MGERAVDARTDIYALGAVTYEMLTGEPPFTGATAQAVVAKVMTERPQRLSAVRDTVPAHVEAAVNKALAKLPADRWSSTAKFAEALVQTGATGAGADAMRAPHHDVAVVDVSTGARRLILATPFEENRPAVSPNGRWLAYASNASGRPEVYVRAFPNGTWQIRLSLDGGTDPVWRADGQELFYYQPDGVIVAVPITPGAADRPAAGVPTRLFGIDPLRYRSFDAASDGKRFLMNLVDPDSVSRPDDVAINWPRLLRQRYEDRRHEEGWLTERPLSAPASPAGSPPFRPVCTAQIVTALPHGHVAAWSHRSTVRAWRSG